MTVVTLVPSKSGRRYAVRFGGETIVESSRDPEHDAARALLARGITGRMTTIGLDGKPRMHLDIETAAKLTVAEPDKGRLHVTHWKPFPSSAVGSPERAESLEAVR